MGWGLILSGNAAGLLLGGLLMLRYRPERQLLVGTLAVLPMALPLLLLAGPAPLLAVVAGAFVAGFAIDIFGVLWNTVMQEQIPPDRISRVYSYDALGSFVFIPIGAAVAGPLAEAIGTGETIVGAAAVIVVATLAVLLAADVRKRRAPQAHAAAMAAS